MNVLTREPSLTAGAFAALVNLGAAFGLSLSGDQVAAMNLALIAVLSVAVRQKVTPQ